MQGFFSDKIQIKLETLSKEKPGNRHFAERSQTLPEYLSIDTYTSWQLNLICKTNTINKNSTDIAGSVIAMPVLYFGFE